MVNPFRRKWPYVAPSRRSRSVGAWGGMWDTSWFRFRATVPDSWAGSEVVALIHLGGDEVVGFTAEGLIWDGHGHIVHGLHHEHREYLLAGDAAGSEQVDFYVEAAANPIPPWRLRGEWPLLMPDYDGAPLYRLAMADLATVDRQVQALDLDVTVLLDLASSAPDRSAEIQRAVATAFELVDPHDVGGWPRRREPPCCQSWVPPPSRARPSSRWDMPTSTAPGSGR